MIFSPKINFQNSYNYSEALIASVLLVFNKELIEINQSNCFNNFINSVSSTFY